MACGDRFCVVFGAPGPSERSRSGNVVLFVNDAQTITIGLVLTVWRIGKKRKAMPGICGVASCYSFRVAELTEKEDRGVDCDLQ